MKAKLPIGVAIAAMLLVLSPPAAHAKPVEDEKWTEYRSENFTIRSLRRKGLTRDVLRLLEMARAVTPALTREAADGSAAAPVIYLFDKPDNLNEVGHEGDSWLHVEEQKGRYVLVGLPSWADVDTYFLRRYARFRSAGWAYERSAYWYSSGMNLYFHNAGIKKGKFWFGGAIQSKALMPGQVQPHVEFLLSDSDLSALPEKELGQLEAVGWLMIRFLTQTTEDRKSFGGKLASYKQMVEQGNGIPESFDKAFGYSIETLSEALADFSAECCLFHTTPIEVLLPEFEPELRTLSREEISLGLGQVAADLGAAERARELLTIAQESELTRDAANASLALLDVQE